MRTNEENDNASKARVVRGDKELKTDWFFVPRRLYNRPGTGGNLYHTCGGRSPEDWKWSFLNDNDEWICPVCLAVASKEIENFLLLCL